MEVTVAFKKYDIHPKFIGKLINSAIKWRTRSKYYHCEIIINNEWISSNPEVGAVYRNKLKSLKANYDYITISVDGRRDKKVQNFIDAQIGKKYDWVGILFSQAIDIHVDDKNEWFCSEIVSYILKLYGVDLQKECNQYSPGGLHRSIKSLDLGKNL